MALFSRKTKPAPQPSTTSIGSRTAATPAPADDPRLDQLGREMLDRARGHKTGLLSAKFYSDALMEWSMKDPAFKVQMFRFVDCFPVLKDTDDIYNHLEDYLGQPGVTVPGVIAAAMKAGKLAKGLAVSQIKSQIEGMAGKFIAGTDAASALPNLRKSWNDGIAFSVDLLGEACVSDAEADAYRDKYLDLIGNLPGLVASWPRNDRLETDHLGPIPRTNVSVKISSLSARCDPIDPDGARRDLMKRLKPILEAAHAKGVFVNFDMEHFALKDFTLDLFCRCCEEIPFDAGLAMQAYLQSGEFDARRICEWSAKTSRRVSVRLVKGAYWDAEVIKSEMHGWPVPVWTTKRATDACFERMTNIFLDATPRAAGSGGAGGGSGGVKLALGSHNVRSIAAALAGLERRGLPRNAIELQMLHGMADQLKYAAEEMGLRVREYVPVGEMIPGMAYLVRRLLENTSNESWLKAGFLDNADPAKLLASPHALSEPEAPARALASNEPDAPERVPSTSSPGIALEGGGRSPGLDPARHALSPAVPGVGDGRAFFTEPMRDFAHGPQREAFAAAVARASVPRLPSDVTPAQAAEMVSRAAAAFPAWRDADPLVRSAMLVRAAAIMRERRDELSAVMIKEAGKTWREADADTCEAIDFAEYYARTAPGLFARQRLGRFIGELDETLYQPRGVAVVISPWNFPLAICAGMTLAALVTGNPVIIKPAEQTTGIAKLLHDILTRAITETTASIPSLAAHRAALAQFCPAPGETTGAALVRDPRVALIAFTGSRDVGLDILHAAAPASPFTSPRPPVPSHLKHVICEMGGKNALIIDTSADHDEAVLAARQSAFGFQGQKCSACSRLIVVDPQGPDGPAIAHFRQRLIAAMNALTIGDPTRPGTDIGPVIDADAARKITGFIDRAKASGLRHAALALPDGLPREMLPGIPAHFVAPHVFWTVPESHELAQEEIFGPVLAVMHAPDFAAALRIANSLPYKLTGGVFSRKPSHIEQAKREFRVGNLYINRGITGALVARQPFGGFAMSGGGTKAGGADYLLHFVEPRAVCENTLRRGFAPEL
jgi:RHH-type transcriptional regulator, proline utilization regulon repressor / proline dehydrogenase / delta 1-pyrroline-5-carboxylate dehydrogenase